MDSIKWVDLESYGQFIKSLHNQVPTSISNRISTFMSDPLSQSILKVLNLTVNESLRQINQIQPENREQYFERDLFVIRNRVRKIGVISKILASLCQFQDSREKSLAEFESVEFYQQMNQANDNPTMFIDFLKGIYPALNVHKDNTPLYIPFYTNLQSYNNPVIGNPNWQISRQNLDFIYRKEMISEKQNNWYLLLTGSKKLVESYKKTPIEELWSTLYYFYHTQTLKPYRNIVPKSKIEDQINESYILDLIVHKIRQTTDKKTALLFQLILFCLTNESEQLNRSIKFFRHQFDSLVNALESDPSSIKQCSEFGLINAMVCQVLHNLIELENKKGIKDEGQINKLQQMLNSTLEVNNILVEYRVPFHDCYLRIAYPAHVDDKNKRQQNETKILQILLKGLQQSTENYPFPAYPYFQTAILQTFSSAYLQKYPSSILKLTNHLPKDVTIWRLLKSEKLNEFETFKQIQHCLLSNKQDFIDVINSKIKIREDDLDGFLEAWNTYHEVFIRAQNKELSFETQIDKVTNCLECLNQLIRAVNNNEEFKKSVKLPLSMTQNITRITDLMIEGFDELFPVLNYEQRVLLLEKYLSFLLDENMKQKVLGVLNTQETTEFWKKWTSVYMTDQDLVNELINLNQPSIEENPPSKQANQTQAKSVPQQVQIMDSE